MLCGVFWRLTWKKALTNAWRFSGFSKPILFSAIFNSGCGS
jgi:hypothetical protein